MVGEVEDAGEVATRGITGKCQVCGAMQGVERERKTKTHLHKNFASVLVGLSCRAPFDAIGPLMLVVV